MQQRLTTLLLSFLSLLAQGCSPTPTSRPSPAEQQGQEDRPYVLLISVDGFRYDYAERFQATNILQFCAAGAGSKSLIPSFPSTTFPNHYTIVTGLYPEHHGIVANNFYDPARRETFRIAEKEKTTDGSWYGGLPLWALAEQQGMRAATFFWPGSDAEIAGARPTFYVPYDASVPHRRRVNQVLEWLRLPASQRPHFVTLYFSSVDTAGEDYGTESAELRRAVLEIDERLGELLGGLRSLPFAVNAFLVSDHGMQDLEPDPAVDLNSLGDLNGFQVVAGGGQVMLYSSDPSLVELTLSRLRGQSTRFEVFRRSELPARLHYSGNPRIGDLVVLATRPILLRGFPPPSAPGAAPPSTPKAIHGYDPAQFPLMHGIFCASGPNIEAGVRLESFENIHIFPLVAEILGLRVTHRIDGSLSVLGPIYRPTATPTSR